MKTRLIKNCGSFKTSVTAVHKKSANKCRISLDKK